MRDLVRKSPKFFLFAALAALALRLVFLRQFPSVSNDSFLYGDIAKNWLQHGVFGLTEAGRVVPTDIRLPGYPAFLALVFSIFGMEHYRAVLCVQIFVDLATCFLISDLARRTLSDRAAKAAFLLAGVCPFLANYSAAALTETLEIFFTVLALDFAVAGLDALEGGRLFPWFGCGAAIAGAILLRPDGGLLLLAVLAYLAFLAFQRTRAGQSGRCIFAAGVVVVGISLLPLVPWALRNLHSMHRFQPLAPRYANAADEVVPTGFNRWVKTWMAEYTSVEEIYWSMPGEAVDANKLPARAFDSAQQRQATLDLFREYNAQLLLSPPLDARFAALATERVHSHPLRYYVWLPGLRIADMWLRPRTELLPSDPRWWEFNDDPKWSALAVAFGAIGLLYIGAALAGVTLSPITKHFALFLTFVMARSVFLGTLENPEPRYTLEMYPVVVIAASALFGKARLKRLP